MTKMSTLLQHRGRVSRRVAGAVALGLVLAGLTVVTTSSANAAIDPCGTGGNKITCENSKAGSPRSVWDLDDGSGDDSIQGFATDISVNIGQRIDFKVDTDASNYSVTIYRLGYYGGDGARQIATVVPSASLPQHQPQCITDAVTELYDCGNWSVSASWNVPATAVSGVYIARLYRADRDDTSHITFIVRDDSSHSNVVFQTSDPTWQAYNTYGGSDFYQGAANGRAYKISYNRPVLTRGLAGGRDFFMSSEYAAVRFMEQNGYDVSYLAGVDTDRYGALVKNHKVFMSVGHDEYWSKNQRANVELARDAGVNLQFLSGNEVYWKTRYEASADSTHTAYRTLVSYKETWANAKIDPTDEWTGTWRDPRFAPTSKGGGRPENALTGTAYKSNFSDLALRVSAEEGKLRLWRNTSLATMSSGGTNLAEHTIGYESDEDVDNGSRPAGLIHLSTTTGAVPEYLQDFGNTTTEGNTTHHLTMYKAASGALVFGAGTVQWAWGLDQDHDGAGAPADPRMRQAQVNLLADMGAQPATIASGLVVASKSTDVTGPTVTIGSPAANAVQANGAVVTVTGTAADSGGRVAGVEASTDGGQTWQAAVGTTSWTYSFVQHGQGATPIRVRAMDDSANIGSTVTRSFAVNCPCSVFGSTTPDTADSGDGSAAELGLRFIPAADGFASGVRFYKSAANTGLHIGSLWSSAGERLASVSFANESASGWQSATFSSAVPLSAGQTYVVSYTAPNGHYAVLPYGFSVAPTSAGSLNVDGGFGSTPAGVFSNPGLYPNASYQNSNYYVDVLFSSADASPLIALNQAPLPGASSVPPTTTISARFSKPVTASTVKLTVKDPTGATVGGTTAYDSASRTATFTPGSALQGFVKYAVTLAGVDVDGSPVSAGNVWSFTVAKPPNTPGVCPCTLFEDDLLPTTAEAPESYAVTLGTRFTADTAGSVTGVRFYKGLNNIGAHVGALWSATGTQLATGTFADESTTGWQTLMFATPVEIAPNTEYIVSYRTTVGRFSMSPNAFANANLSRTPLHVTSTSGAYTYDAGFPAYTSASNYLVDVMFEKGAPTLKMSVQDPAPGALDVPRGTSISVVFSHAIKTSGYTFQVRSGSTDIPGTVALGSDDTKLTFTPSSMLPPGSDVTVTLDGVVSTENVSLGTKSWTFRTRTPSTTDQTLFSDTLPTTIADNDGAAVELGTAVTPSKDGTITAVRFLKGNGNGGTHTGSLWSSTGERLATVTFSNETALGWQTATFATPVAVTAGETYVVSYLAPQGHYSYTPGFFASPWTSGDLTAPAANNGRFSYGGGFPQFSWNATNYFVDVVFKPALPSIVVRSRTPGAGATGVDLNATAKATFSAALAAGYSMTASVGATAVPGSVAISADRKTLTFTPTSLLPVDADVTVKLTGVVSSEGATLPPTSWTFHTDPSATVDVSLFAEQDPAVQPAVTSANDWGPLELGTAFTPSKNGEVTAIRFFKGDGNTGTHTGSIWSSTGTRLATVTFTNESATGWQTATLTSPLALSAGSTYVVSYFAPNGHYAVTSGFFATAWTSGPLTAPASDAGRYFYGSNGGFPTDWWNGSNYFVDVVFRSELQ